jgi:type III restriction enzyme/adenine-specific DNA-methyltransferase
VYNDSFDFTSETLAERLSIDEEQARRILDLARRGSASHSAWLMFMYPRLLLARDLLSKNGAIFISIDDNEQSNLKLLCDDVFGEENFIGQITVVANPRGRDYGGVARMHDYVFVYMRSDETKLNLIEDENNEFTLFDATGGFELRELRNRNIKFNKENRPNLYYPFYINPEEKDDNGLYTISLESKQDWIELYPLPSQGINVVWRWGKAKSQQFLNTEIKAKAMRNGGYMIVEKYREGKAMTRSVWWDKETNTEKGTLHVKELMKGKVFDYPKPVEMIMRILEMGMTSDGEDTVVDFFSGSGTTAHAAFSINAKDGGNRKFIMVQIPETVKAGSEAEHVGYITIDQIGRERIKRAADEVRIANQLTGNDLDLGFKHFTLAEPSQSTLDKLEEFDPNNNALVVSDLLTEFGKATVLATWLVRDGYGFTQSAQEIDFAGYTAHYIGKHLYLIDGNLSNEAIMAIIEHYETNGEFNPENVVLFGYSFTWTERETLQTNLKRLKDTERNLRVNFDIRY